MSGAGVELGFLAARDALAEIAFRRAGVYPRDRHSRHYHSEQLRGDKPMQGECFEEFLLQIQTTHGSLGREVVRRILDRFLARFGMRAADCDGAVVSLDGKSIDQEQLDAFMAVSEFQLLVDEFERLRDPRTRRAAKRAGDRAKAEITEVQLKVGGEAS